MGGAGPVSSRIPSALPIDDEPAGADPDVGAIGYYSPGNDLVLYYVDQSYFDGIVVLGRMTGDPERLADIGGDVEVSVTLIEQ